MTRICNTQHPLCHTTPICAFFSILKTMSAYLCLFCTFAIHTYILHAHLKQGSSDKQEEWRIQQRERIKQYKMDQLKVTSPRKKCMHTHARTQTDTLTHQRHMHRHRHARTQPHKSTLLQTVHKHIRRKKDECVHHMHTCTYARARSQNMFTIIHKRCSHISYTKYVYRGN
jgi:hypothetical protein